MNVLWQLGWICVRYRQTDRQSVVSSSGLERYFVHNLWYWFVIYLYSGGLICKLNWLWGREIGQVTCALIKNMIFHVKQIINVNLHDANFVLHNICTPVLTQSWKIGLRRSSCICCIGARLWTLLLLCKSGWKWVVLCKLVTAS